MRNAVANVSFLFDDAVDVGVGFVAESVNVTEAEGRVQVCVEMAGYTAIPLTLTLSTREETALGKNSSLFGDRFYEIMC